MLWSVDPISELVQSRRKLLVDVVSELTSVPVLGSADPIPESIMRSRRKLLAEL